MLIEWTQPLNRIQRRELLEFYLFIYLLIYYYCLGLCLQLQICLHCSINLIAYLCFKLSPECPHRKYLRKIWRSCALHLWWRLWVTFLMNTSPGFLHGNHILSRRMCMYVYTSGPSKSCNGKEAPVHILLPWPMETEFPCHCNRTKTVFANCLQKCRLHFLCQQMFKPDVSLPDSDRLTDKLTALLKG